jgi:hypothetical protein
MSLTQLKRIAIALVAAIFIWGLTVIVSRGGDVVEEAQLIPAIVSADVDRVEIAGTDDTVRLARTDSSAWTVNGFAAAPDAVTTLLTALGEVVTGELVAQNPSSHERMGVDEVGAKRLRVSHGDETVANVLLGRQGRAYRTIYARRDGENNVYLLRGELVPLIDRTLNDWRDKRIVAVEPDSIVRVAVERGSERYTLVRGDSMWTFADGSPTDSGAVAGMLGEFQALTAQGSGFATPVQADSADFRRPDRRVSLFGARGETLADLVFDSTDTGFWVRRSDRETVYQLFRWRVDDLTPVESVLRGQ